MFVVIFEVQPKKQRFDDYLSLAKYLKPRLEAVDGFIDNERYRSIRTPARVLSLSTWRDEKSVVRWRSQSEHHAVQAKGRLEIFEDYRLRVGEVVEDSDPPPGLTVAQQRFDETANPGGTAASITEIVGAEEKRVEVETGRLSAVLGLDRNNDGLIDHEVFESIYIPGKVLVLATRRDAAAAGTWAPVSSSLADAKLRHRRVRVIRDYGMYDRREAPQFYPDVTGARGAAAE